MRKLSPRQEAILQLIRQFIEEQGYPPTVRDIQRACHLSSTSVVDYNLNILQKYGHIRRSPEVSRGIGLLPQARQRLTARVPLIGYIAAGEPLPVFSAQAEPLEILELATSLTRGEEDLYALRVRGTSMIDALIDDGDLVVLKPTKTINNGDTVVAWIRSKQEATLKRFYYDGDRVRLQPANSQMAPLLVAPDDVEVQGRVIAVVRNLA
ncbi:MAG: repressor LexA [Chloroflexi bacterium]|nr:repressor LexA [Chloroflexota bacterium]